MSKKYALGDDRRRLPKQELPESEEAKLVSEPILYENAVAKDTNHQPCMFVGQRNDELTFDSDDAPCQYSLDQIHVLLERNREDYGTQEETQNL